jgi:hypothetical protein
MDDNSANKYVDTFFEFIVNAKTDEEKRRMVRLLVKEVERDTRNNASAIAQKALHDITYMIHNPSHLSSPTPKVESSDSPFLPADKPRSSVGPRP